MNVSTLQDFANQIDSHYNSANAFNERWNSEPPNHNCLTTLDAKIKHISRHIKKLKNDVNSQIPDDKSQRGKQLLARITEKKSEASELLTCLSKKLEIVIASKKSHEEKNGDQDDSTPLKGLHVTIPGDTSSSNQDNSKQGSPHSFTSNNSLDTVPLSPPMGSLSPLKAPENEAPEGWDLCTTDKSNDKVNPAADFDKADIDFDDTASEASDTKEWVEVKKI